MCDRHSPSSISRRGVAGLLAAGVGLAAAPLQASAQDAAGRSADTLCLMCIDHKFAADAFKFFNSSRGPGPDQYDVVALAGASLAGITPRTGKVPFPATFAALREQLIFAKQPAGKGLHPEIKRVVVFDHLGCGAYENEYGKLPIDQELVWHQRNAIKVKDWLASQLGLESSFWIIDTPGGNPDHLI
jgi:hypothetical protein